MAVAGVMAIFADQLTLSQPEGANYAHQITTGTPRFSKLPTALGNINFLNNSFVSQETANIIHY